MYVSGELKRDDFRETLLGKLGEQREKISRGKKEQFILFKSGFELARICGVCNTEKFYKITIMEV
jgi:hypothetical protein